MLETAIRHEVRRYPHRGLAESGGQRRRRASTKQGTHRRRASDWLRVGQEAHHRTVTVTYRGITVPVDTQLASLLEMLWRFGVRTSGSCQRGYRRFAYITFDTGSDAEVFLGLVARHERGKDSLSRRLPGHWAATEHQRHRRGLWSYSVSIHPAREPAPLWSVNLEAAITVFFPPADIPEITKRVAASLAGIERSRTRSD